MTYNQFFNKDKETVKFLLADAFGSILGMGLYTSVVNPLPEPMTESNGIKRLKSVLSFICKNSREAIMNNYTSHKAFIS